MHITFLYDLGTEVNLVKMFMLFFLCFMDHFQGLFMDLFGACAVLRHNGATVIPSLVQKL